MPIDIPKGTSLLKLTNDRKLAHTFNKLPDRIAKKILRPAISYALTPVVKDAKQRVPVEYGFLREEIGKKVSGSKAWGKVYVKPARYTTPDGITRKPANYAHLVEFGTKDTSRRPFLRSAMGANKGIALNRMAQKGRQKLNSLRWRDV